MPELNDSLFTAPLESVQRPKSNVERFPTIGQHLIDHNTPAYAATEPPESGPAVVVHRSPPAQCPPCTGRCRHGRDCPAPDTVPTDYGSGYGDDAIVAPSRVVPCSTVARWALAVRRWLLG